MWTVLQDHAIWTATGCVILVALVWLIGWLMKEFRRETAVDRFDPKDLLSNFAEMKRQGEISPEEFHSIEAAVGKRPKSIPDRTDQGD